MIVDSEALTALDPPFAVVDLDAFDANLEDLLRRANGKPLRLASKSLRVRDLQARALLGDILADQNRNIRWLMPSAVAFQCLSWWLVHAYPEAMLAGHWHLLAIGASLAFTLQYLHGGVQLLHRRQHWILERATQERGEP